MPTRHRLSLLAPLLTSERQALSRLVIEATDLAGREQVDGAHVRALGSVLHDWYTGCEKVFLDHRDRHACAGAGEATSPLASVAEAAAE